METSGQISTQPGTQLYILDPQTNTIRLTRTGATQLAHPFFRAGIDVRAIKTVQQFEEAMEKALPYVLEACEERETDPKMKKAMGEFRDLLISPPTK